MAEKYMMTGALPSPSGDPQGDRLKNEDRCTYFQQEQMRKEQRERILGQPFQSRQDDAQSIHLTNEERRRSAWGSAGVRKQSSSSAIRLPNNALSGHNTRGASSGSQTTPKTPANNQYQRHQEQSRRTPARPSSPWPGRHEQPSGLPVPNFSRPNPNYAQHLSPTDAFIPPPRITSVRPSSPPNTARPAKQEITQAEADTLCKKLCARVWNENMARMWDRVVDADRMGNIDDTLYWELLDFFYCFVPMVTKSPPTDPIVVRSPDLVCYKKVMDMFREGEGDELARHYGRNAVHTWYSRPSDGSTKARWGQAFKGVVGAIKGKSGKDGRAAIK